MLETAHIGPGGSPHSLNGVVILKRNNEAFEGHVMENEHVDDRGQGHQKQSQAPFRPKATGFGLPDEVPLCQFHCVVCHMNWKRFHYRVRLHNQRINNSPEDIYFFELDHDKIPARKTGRPYVHF